MRVIFTKGHGTAYEITIHRDVGAVLAPRNGVGGHDYLPHDLVHFVVESVVGIERGVFGELAAGGNGIFWPSDPAERRKAMRHRKKEPPYPTTQVQADHERSERLVRASIAVWEQRRGLIQELPAYVTAVPTPPGTDDVVAALDTYADRWHSLPVGETLTLDW